MLYIKIPKGMFFKQVEDENFKPIKDILIDDSGKTINLQEVVQEVLRDRRSYEANKIKTEGLIILFKPLQIMDDSYLLYEPNRNGKFPTIKPVALGSEYKSGKENSANSTRYGEFWHQKIPMSAEKRQEVLEAQAEQRENRRKSGDCPNTN